MTVILCKLFIGGIGSSAQPPSLHDLQIYGNDTKPEATVRLISCFSSGSSESRLLLKGQATWYGSGSGSMFTFATLASALFTALAP